MSHINLKCIKKGIAVISVNVIKHQIYQFLFRYYLHQTFLHYYLRFPLFHCQYFLQTVIHHDLHPMMNLAGAKTDKI